MVRLDGKFKDWVIDEKQGIIFDDGNNQYTVNDVRATFYERQLVSLVIGNQYNIRSLKKDLEEKYTLPDCYY